MTQSSSGNEDDLFSDVEKGESTVAIREGFLKEEAFKLTFFF